MSALQGLRRLEGRSRHRATVWLLWATVVALPIVALLSGMSLGVTGAFVAALAIVGMLGWRAGETRSRAFRSLVEMLEEGVVMLDRHGSLAASNPSAMRILGM